MLTVEYDRDAHKETIVKKDLQEVITILYDDSDLPTSFSPANGHHTLNITYRQDGHISHWQYGEIREQRQGYCRRYCHQLGLNMSSDIDMDIG